MFSSHGFSFSISDIFLYATFNTVDAFLENGMHLILWFIYNTKDILPFISCYSSIEEVSSTLHLCEEVNCLVFTDSPSSYVRSSSLCLDSTVNITVLPA